MSFWKWLLSKIIRTAHNIYPSISNWWRTPENQNSSILAFAFLNLFASIIEAARSGYIILLWLIPTALLFMYYQYRSESLKGAKPNEP